MPITVHPAPAGKEESFQSRNKRLDLPTPIGSDARAAALPLLLAALRSGDARDQAAALLIEHDWYAVDGVRLQTPMLRLGLRSGDSAVLAAGVALCVGGKPRADCIEAAQRWTALEPQNAAAWLARIELDPDSEQASMLALQNATRHQVHSGALAARALARMPQRIAPYIQMDFLNLLIGKEGASVGPMMLSTLQMCSATGPGSKRNEQGCTTLPEILLRKSDTQTARSIAIAIAIAMGRPDIEALRAENESLLTALRAANSIDREQPHSCAAVYAFKARVEAQGRLGEIGLAKRQREKAASSPK